MTQASPESPPALFWSPSWTITWMRYEWPATSGTSQRTSAPYPSLASPAGTGSAPVPRFQLFFVGSASGVMVILFGVTVLSTERTAAFQVPNTAVGVCGTPPFCQSPDVSLELAVTS